VLVRLAQGECIGSELRAELPVLSARKQWMADHLRLRGRLVLDAGAIKALVLEGKSLLPIGVRAVEGEFEPGDVVACVDAAGKECARGLVNYSSADTRRIMGQPSAQIVDILGVMPESELMHRDNLIILG
jgi:glutamate 5-kinase